MTARIAGIFVSRHRLYCKEVGEFSLIEALKEAEMRVSKVAKKIVAGLLLSLLTIFTAPVSPASANEIALTSPASGALLTLTPNSVSITTTSPLIDQGNSIIVSDPNDVEVTDGSLVITNTTATAGLKPLTASGTYTVTYLLISDGEGPVSGSYTFTFKSPGAVSSATPMPSSTSTPMTVSSGGTSTFIYVLIVMAIAVAAFLYWYARQTFGGSRKKKKRRK
jgi:methionine-rich copper-binding protein CopC